MSELPHVRPAPDGPGLEARWTRAQKDGVGTANTVASKVWFTLADGGLTEIYWPTIDRPQIRDVQFLVTDGESFFQEERRDLETTTELIEEHVPGFKVVNTDPDGRYRIVKEIVSAPDHDAVLVNVQFEVAPAWVDRLTIYVLVAPHLEIGGAYNSGWVTRRGGRLEFLATKGSTWLAVGSAAFAAGSVGFVGVNDGWQDIADNFEMDWQFDAAIDGNIAFLAEVDPGLSGEFTVGLAFSDCRHGAETGLLQVLGHHFAETKEGFAETWRDCHRRLPPLEGASSDGGKLFHMSHALLLSHQDKHYPGALIASLSIPWGEHRGDEDLGGYHLVWTRDLVNSVTGLLAAGHTETPLAALMYLAASQRSDGGFFQNFWITGRPYWQGVQLDEVAFPIMLAWRLFELGALEAFDPTDMVRRAARYLVVEGPVTPQERWEENSGYSPSTLAAVISGLICAASLLRDVGDLGEAQYFEEYADFLEQHIERWTVTNSGSILDDVARHYVRINPVDPGDPDADETLAGKTVRLANQADGVFPVEEIVDAGFLELVRYGIREPGDPLVEDSLRVVDAVLRAELPQGPAWYRYPHDGYGQHDDGGPFAGTGVGRPWPLLAGERAHYELAAGRPVGQLIKAIEGFAHGVGLLPEQVWDRADRNGLVLGGPTGAAMPLMWAHAEYVKLLRSVIDGEVFDRLPPVVARYRGATRPAPAWEVWKPNRHVRSIAPGQTLRIQAPRPFVLRWTCDDWASLEDTEAATPGVDIWYVDLEPSSDVSFTFRWLDGWEGRNYTVRLGGST